MVFCYLDESGKANNPNDFVITGMISSTKPDLLVALYQRLINIANHEFPDEINKMKNELHFTDLIYFRKFDFIRMALSEIAKEDVGLFFSEHSSEPTNGQTPKQFAHESSVLRRKAIKNLVDYLIEDNTKLAERGGIEVIADKDFYNPAPFEDTSFNVTVKYLPGHEGVSFFAEEITVTTRYKTGKHFSVGDGAISGGGIIETDNFKVKFMVDNNNPILQLADLVTGAIATKIRRSDDSYWKIISKKFPKK